MSSRRWAFISDHRADFGVKRICRALGVSRAGYYRHLATEQVRTERQAEEKRTGMKFAPSTPNTGVPIDPKRL